MGPRFLCCYQSLTEGNSDVKEERPLGVQD